MLVGLLSMTLGATSEGEITRTIVVKEESKYKAIFLDEEVYRYAKADLSDLRIKEADGTNVPYYIQNKENLVQMQTANYETYIINDFNKKDKRYIEVEVQNTRREVQDILINQLTLEVENDNFAKSIRVEGSYDRLSWESIDGGKESPIYKVEAGEQLEIVLDKVVKYPYFRISFPSHNEKLQINKVYATYTETLYEERQYEKMKQLNFAVEDQLEEGQTIIAIDNSSHLDFSRMRLEVGAQFKRRYEVIGKNKEGEKIPLTNGVIYSSYFQEEVFSDTIIPLEGIGEYIAFEIIIYNQDDEPLKITGIEGSYNIDKLVFQGEPNESYQLTYGDESLHAPKYDIEDYRKNIEKEVQEVCVLGVLNKEIQEEKKAINYSLIYKVLLGVVSIVLIGVIMRSLNKKEN